MKKVSIGIILAILLTSISYAQQSSCDYKVEILVDGEEFESDEFKWRMRAVKLEGKPTNITGTAEIQAKGKTVKSYKPWTSDPISKQKTSNEYSPNLKPGDYKITAEISVECDDTNKDNNVDTKEIKIKGEIEETKSKKSKSEETKTINQEAQNEESTNSNIETVTTKSKKSMASKEIENTIELTLQKTNQQNQNVQQPTAQAIQNPEMVYVSSNEKAKALIMIFLLTLSILLNIILIWKR